MINPYRIIIKNGIWVRVPAHLVRVTDELPLKRYYLDYPELKTIKEVIKHEVVKNRESKLSSQVCSNLQ